MKEFQPHRIDDNIWYLGQNILRKYFTVMDNRPQYLAWLEDDATEEKIHYKTKNFLGVAACKSHNAMIDSAQLRDDSHYHRDTRKPSSSAGVAIAVIIVIIMIAGTAIYIGLQHRKRNAKTKDAIATSTFA